MSDLPNKDDHWFSSDCRQAFEGVVERIGCSNGKSILVGLKALLFIIYHLEQQGQGDQIRVVDVDVSLEDGPNFIQALSLRHEGQQCPLWILFSMDQIKRYPDIDDHIDALNRIGFQLSL